VRIDLGERRTHDLHPRPFRERTIGRRVDRTRWQLCVPSKNRSIPAGVNITRSLATRSPVFWKQCGVPRGMDTNAFTAPAMIVGQHAGGGRWAASPESATAGPQQGAWDLPAGVESHWSARDPSPAAEGGSVAVGGAETAWSRAAWAGHGTHWHWYMSQ
jgi:hypothetical protein